MLSVILEWNKLDIYMRNSTSISIFKNSSLQFFRPSPNSLFNGHSPKDIKYEIWLQFGHIHLWEHNFKHSFQDTTNLFSDCGCEIETTARFPLHCPQFYTERNTLFNKIKNINTSTLNQNNSNFTKTLVFGDPLNSVIIDTLILLLIDTIILLEFVLEPILCFSIYRHVYF